MFLPLPFVLEEIVVPLVVRVGTIPSLLAVLLDIVKDELATSISEGTTLSGLVVASAGLGSSALGSSSGGRWRRAGHGTGRCAGCVVI